MTSPTTTTQTTGLIFNHYYSQAGEDPYDTVVWEKRDARITDSKGEIVFEQNNIEVPADWSHTASNIVASKYFCGQLGTPRRENSVRQLIGRVADTISTWGNSQGYFANKSDVDIFRTELIYILLHQIAAFNSPVWFNVGTPRASQGFVWDSVLQTIRPVLTGIEHHPQASACFINGVTDTMESILDLAKTEGMLFKGGSGAGTNLSDIREENARLTNGGNASGPLSFMKGFDAFAGVIKSGGGLRRAAKMVILDADHPDIEKFIWCKVNEEKKAHALIAAGYDPAIDGEAYTSIFYQNSNNSVRITDEFMRAVEADDDWNLVSRVNGTIVTTIKARNLFRQIAEATWQCGDPGIQFHTTINNWHTSSNSGPIRASNPCAEYLYVDDSACNLASINLVKFLLDGILNMNALRHVTRVMITAQEILVDNASYPTARIAENSHNLRPLGLGFANLGALLMHLGLPYDSDEGRDWAGSITAVMTGQAYLTSAEIAGTIGPMPGWELNHDPFIKVMEQHTNAAVSLTARTFDKLQYHVDRVWHEALALGYRNGYRNGQVTVTAPTGCLVAGSMISTNRGLLRLGNLGDKNGAQWQNISLDVMTDQGPRKASKFYINGIDHTRRLTTGNGYVIQGTDKHRIKVLAKDNIWEWKRMDEVCAGDIVPLAMNTIFGDRIPVRLPSLNKLHHNCHKDTGVPEFMNAELACLVGLFMANGSLHKKGLRFHVYEEDTDSMEWIENTILKLFGIQCLRIPGQGLVAIYLNSTPLRSWWKKSGFAKTGESSGKGWHAHIPETVLETNDPVIYRAFLRGVFDADGSCCGGTPDVTTVNMDFAMSLKNMLLALGFPTSYKIDLPTEGKFGTNPVHKLRIKNYYYNSKFMSDIGFIASRKNNKVITTMAMTPRNDLIYMPDILSLAATAENTHNMRAVRASVSRTGGIPRHLMERLPGFSTNQDMIHASGFFYDTVEENSDGGMQPTYDLSVPDNVTYIANGFISHNTIGFMMDVDTTGIEPELALIKYKKMVGGGVLKLVNGSVESALKLLGYSIAQIETIIKYIDSTGTIEGAPELRNEHLAVFDCSFKAQNGKRSIHYMGHIKMLAAVQPFLSGSSSKTCNVPEDATVDDIMNAYMEAWKLGVKCVAIYRDGSKKSQPLNTSADTRKEVAPDTVDHTIRRKLPDERQSITHKFTIGGHEGYLTVGMFPDGTPGEIFVTMAKEGSTISGLADTFATAISYCLQYGVELKFLANKFQHIRFEPSGWTGNPQIPYAKSIPDYIFQWMTMKFGASVPALPVFDYTPESVSLPEPVALSSPASDAPPCSDCGSLMVPNGRCYRCPNCGGSSGCS